jgi:hypothetical protein
MLQEMFNASLAVLRRPSVSTFEEYERDNAGNAALYVIVGTVIAAILGAIGFFIKRPYIEAQLRQAQAQLEQLGGNPAGVQAAFQAFSSPTSLLGAVVGEVLWALIGFFIWVGLVYLVGRAFGGTGTFGQLAYDVSLFWVPLAVIRALVNLIAFGPLAVLAGLISLAVGIYNLILTFFGIQAGMNLPPNKAIIIMLLPLIISLVICCGLTALLAPFLIGAGRTAP